MLDAVVLYVVGQITINYFLYLFEYLFCSQFSVIINSFNNDSILIDIDFVFTFINID